MDPLLLDTQPLPPPPETTPFPPIIPEIPPDLARVLLQFPMPPPELVAVALDPAGKAQPETRTPTYPRWFRKDPPKPTQAEIEDLYADRSAYYAGYINRVSQERVRIRVTDGAAPDDFKRDQGDQVVASPRLRQDFDLAVNLIAAMEEVIDVPYADQSLEEATQQVEDWLYEVRDQEVEQHALAGRGGALEYAEADHMLAHGKLATRVTCVTDDDRWFFDLKLVPATEVFPLYDGKRGLRAVVHAYTDTVANVIGDFDDEKGTIRKELTSARTKQKGDREQRLDARVLTDRIPVIDYYDRWWHIVIADGSVVFEAEHKYGEPPWVITPSGYGNTAGGAAPVMTFPSGEVVTVSGSNQPTNNPDESRFMDCSFLTFRIPVLNQHELLLGRFATEMDMSKAPPIMLGQDDFAAERAAPIFRWRKRAVNTFDRDHEQPLPMPTAPNPNVFGPILQEVQAEIAHGFFPDPMHGINDKSNVSGYAITGLNQSGAHHLTLWIMMRNRHQREKYQLCCRLFQRFGHLHPAVEGSGAKLRYRQPKRKQNPCFTFTPEILDQTGTKVHIDTKSLRMQDWGPFASAASQLNQLGILTKRQIRTEMNQRDPDRTWMEWIDEQLDTDPDVMDIRKLKAVRETNDVDLIRLISQRIQSKSSQGNQQPPQLGPAGGLPPTTAGVSLPGYGAGPGPGSGPPGMTPFPPGAAPPTEY